MAATSQDTCADEAGAPAAAVVVVVCKLPTAAGLPVKTRLAAGTNAAFARAMALAMLRDVLRQVEQAQAAARVLFFAPADALHEARRVVRGESDGEGHGDDRKEDKGESVSVEGGWLLLPMPGADAESMRGTDLGALLAHARTHVQELVPGDCGGGGAPRAVCFVGMDCVTMGAALIRTACRTAKTKEVAYCTPAQDGGYTLLVVPGDAPDGVFEGVEWSSSNTCLTQACALGRCGVPVLFGPTQLDVDEVDDAHNLWAWLTASDDRRVMAPATLRVLLEAEESGTLTWSNAVS